MRAGVDSSWPVKETRGTSVKECPVIRLAGRAGVAYVRSAREANLFGGYPH